MIKNKKNRKEIHKIAIIGSGVVGSATGRGLISKGFEVLFVDANVATVNALRRQGYQAFLPEDFDPSKSDIFFMSVPSYTDGYATGLSYLSASAETLGKWVSSKKDYSLVVVRSTVLPGTTEEVIIPTIEKYSGKKAGADFGVCVNPEYLREKTAASDFENPWLVVIGEKEEKDGDILEGIYAWVNCPLHRVSIKEAEMQKFIHNICNANKISFFNEMRLVCNQLNVDSDKIFSLVTKSAESFWNPLYGTANLGAFGGACLPKDSNAFLQFARNKLGIDLRLLQAVLDVNMSVGSNSKVRGTNRKMGNEII